mmetsp:Transcript_33633/g.43308  ORF Transcript_33633/g.43308 Transcript_33633/m.43308 type:complete len:217 (-) Transcript_33633:255-905(-)
MWLDIAKLVREFAGAGLVRDAEADAVMGAVTDQLSIFIVELRHQVVCIFARLSFGVSDNNMHTEAIINHAIIVFSDGMNRFHPFGELVLGFRPHQIHIAMAPTEFERRWRVAAEIEQGAACLIGFGWRCREPAEIIDLALIVELVLCPSLLQDLDDFVGAFVTIGALGDFARKVRTDHIQGQSPFEHMIQSRDRARQHDGLHFTASNRGEHIDRLG